MGGMRRSGTVLAVLAAVAATGSGAAVGATTRQADDDAPRAISVFPAAGTPTASPRSEISLRGAAPDRLEGVTVTGSRTGRHTGRLAAHSDGRGASFVSARRFARGETVTVDTGDRTVRFRIAANRQGMPPSPPSPRVSFAKQTRRYHSRPDLRPPRITIHKPAEEGVAPGLLFLGPKQRNQEGGLIVDDAGEPVWVNPTPPGRRVNDFRVQEWRGKPMLTWWQGRTTLGFGEGRGVIANSSYEVVKRVSAGNGYRADMHEFRITPENTALMLVYQFTRRDLRRWGGGRRQQVVDSIVQEIDIPTGRVLFEWHSLGQVGLGESVEAVPQSVNKEHDYFHVNSVDKDADGNYLVSARHTSAVYKISGRTGQVIWRLGGKKSDFRLGKGASFHKQHDARFQDDGTIRILDNSDEAHRHRTRSIVLRLDEKAKTASLVREVGHGKLFASTQANSQPLPNGNLLIEWGSQGRVTEHDAAGRAILDVELPDGYDSYRGYRFPWTGTPKGRPSVAGTAKAVYASWNGATEVATWELLAGPSADALTPVREVPRAGFETRIPGGEGRFVAVRAKAADGTVLGTSAAERRG